MMKEYLEKYGISKPENFEFSKRNLIIGKNGSGKTCLLKAVRDYFHDGYKDVIYLYFPSLSSRFEKSFEEENVDNTLADIVKEKEDMSFDAFVLMFQYTGVSLLETYVNDLKSRATETRKRAEKTLNLIEKNLRAFLNINILFEKEIQIEFANGNRFEIKEALTRMSPGEINLFYISIFLSIASEKRKFILLLDEPEMHVHPSVVIKFYNALKNMKCIGEIWIATHSPLLLQEFDFDEITLVSEGKVCSRNSHLYENVMNEMLGENRDAISKLFRSIDEWEYCNFIAECFTNPIVVDRVSKKDEQAVKFMNFCEEMNKSGMEILDWGAGTGRLGMCLEQISKDMENPPKYVYEIYEPGKACNNKFKTYRKIEEISRQYDCVVLMNVLHEIGIREWANTFSAIKKVLKENGYLVFAEAKTLSLGEQPDCENGYLVLGEEQLKKLFEGEDGTPEMLSVSENTDKNGKSEFIIVPACELKHISEANIKSALENLQSKTLIKLKEMDMERIQSVRRGKKPSFTYRKYAFVSQQYVNVTLALKSDFFAKYKFKVQVVRGVEVNNDDVDYKIPKNRHTVKNLTLGSDPIKK